MGTPAAKLDLTALERSAFPSDHPVTLVDLRGYAYAQKARETPDPGIAEHVASCAHCERQLTLLRTADPILNGQEDQLMTEMLKLAESPERQQIAEEKARTATASATANIRAVVHAAAAAFQAVAGRSKT